MLWQWSGSRRDSVRRSLPAANAAPNPADFLTIATASVISAIAED
jgi:hypothetical protein